MKPRISFPLVLRYERMFSFLLFISTWVTTSAQNDSNYSILVAGHAYGAHAGANIGLHPPFLDKLRTNPDSRVTALFLTGDIVNQSTTASWNQVEKELSGLGLTSYYVMGNHDNNPVGLAVFKKKYGATYYSLSIQNDLYIILNSTESDRSISPNQLQFLDEILKVAKSSQKRIFIFFHEVIWNSSEKYRLVRSNNRSRYEYMVNISNFWNQVFPMLTAYPEKKFYLFAGDVGGNPDAIAASYDRWGNVTLISSGMGEVKDENYLKVNILPDTVTYQLIPLQNELEMKAITWYNVPEKPGAIEGPSIINPLESSTKFQILPVGNATSYRWSLSDGISGSSDSSAINLRFDANFQIGKITVSAINDGFGESEPSVLEVFTESTAISEKQRDSGFGIQQNQQSIQLSFYSEIRTNARIRIFDQMGRLILSDFLLLNSGTNTQITEKHLLGKGLVFVELSVGNKRLIRKIIL